MSVFAYTYFLNALNNTVSGAKLAVEGSLHESLFCTVNGFVGQLTVQAQDFSTLIIAIATFVALSNPLRWIRGLSFIQIHEVWIHLFIWGVPLTTAMIGLLTVGYVPVSGNWCWLPAEPVWVRYALTHGIRFAIIPTVLLIYLRLFIILKRSSPDDAFYSQTKYPSQDAVVEPASGYNDSLNSGFSDVEHEPPRGKWSGFWVKMGWRRLTSTSGKTDTTPMVMRSLNSDKRIATAMLRMCIYPVMYTVCWVPGISNRILEISGGKSELLATLQAATQFIGFFDALLYGITENLRHEIRELCSGYGEKS
ncbi:hypothetical protein K493DRAFT_410083 [Basidiobolus meristosporus CBS 931.73]|uniref:Glucose receptor Git3-like N-terminal domain-containing protein n=1 Tax=Basidiobolus meristosporus CBS 931.73 TaxID=1314790 RepID=A0A1Y1XW82_9FUNG|nr:hypothetical protein K493DRAFT_410083 [Basidiobolus meristosporus CBS 931.73]|eukprot:ORX90021.1 hypothetical protein K493DRAFT_410083 [Basidiobolus meristosporus CBS 931.73]